MFKSFEFAFEFISWWEVCWGSRTTEVQAKTNLSDLS